MFGVQREGVFYGLYVQGTEIDYDSTIPESSLMMGLGVIRGDPTQSHPVRMVQPMSMTP